MKWVSCGQCNGRRRASREVTQMLLSRVEKIRQAWAETRGKQLWPEVGCIQEATSQKLLQIQHDSRCQRWRVWPALARPLLGLSCVFWAMTFHYRLARESAIEIVRSGITTSGII